MWPERDGRLLLVKAPGSPYFLPPGGILEGSESPEEAGIRELFEETGLSPVGPLTMLSAFRAQRGGPELFDVSYHCLVGAGEVRLSAEHDDYTWIDPAEYRPLVSSVIESIADQGL